MKKSFVFVFLFYLSCNARLTHGGCGSDTEEQGQFVISPETLWQTIPPPLDCNHSIQAAIVTPEGETIFFQDDWYWALQLDCSVVDGYPRPIADDWPGLPSYLDAALSLWDNRIYFFKGRNYWRYEGKTLQSGYPKKIRDGFCGVKGSLTSATYWPANLATYLFKGDQVFRFDGAETMTSSPIPKHVSDEWYNLPNDMDAALTWYNGKTYFFRDGEYWRYDTYGVDTSIYPLPTFPAWGEDCQSLNKRIDALKRHMEH